MPVPGAQRVLRRCLEAGARLARPGEFTLRAFLNGRLDLSQVGRRAGHLTKLLLHHLVYNGIASGFAHLYHPRLCCSECAPNPPTHHKYQAPMLGTRAINRSTLLGVQAESVAQLVEARTVAAADSALAGLAGGLGREVAEMRAECIDLLTEMDVR